MAPNQERTWPADALTCLERHHDLFLGWENQRGSATPTVDSDEYERALYGLRGALNGHPLHGYRCTCLTTVDIAYVLSKGMQLPNATMLRRRIQD